MKRNLCMITTILMVIGLFPLNALAYVGGNGEELNTNSIEQMIEENFLELFNSEEEREFIIELKDSDSVNYKSSSIEPMSKSSIDVNDLAESISFSRKGQQDLFLSEINSKQGGFAYKVKSLFSNNSEKIRPLRSFTYLVNGMTLKLSYNQLLDLATNPMVKNIYYNAKISKPENEIIPNMSGSGDMIGAGKPESRSFDGQGRLVAVLDSGIDASHPDMRISDPSKAKYSREDIEKIKRELGLKGEFLSDKIPYAYNYMDDNMEVKDTTDMTAAHGMHVSGIIAANGKIKGVTPEAQIIMMRVFSNLDAKTDVSTYVKALDDAVILGADSVNMSLGTLEEGVENVPAIFTNAVENAIKKGTAVVVSAGNNMHFAQRMNLAPWSEYPDWGVVGTPSIGKDTISVASVDNMMYKVGYGVFACENGDFDRSFEMVRPGKSYNSESGEYETPGNFNKGFKYSKEYEFVYCDYGIFDEEYKNPDGSSKVDGKVALILRGYDKEKNPELEYDPKWYYNSKIKKAEEFGAVAVIVGNSLNGQDGLYGLREMTQVEVDTIPSYFINHYSYLELLKFSDKRVKFEENPMVETATGGMPSDFSSWGPTSDLGIKPEISAPGGQIYSTVNYDAENEEKSYRYDSGTSMSAPHVTAGVAAINKVLDDNGFAREDRFKIAKALMLSTAAPLKVRGQDNLFYSPRQQGAGMMRLDKASNKHFVLAKDNRASASSYGMSKIEFKDLRGSNSLNFDVLLESLGSQGGSTEYSVDIYVQTDKIENGYEVTLKPEALAKFENVGSLRLEDGSSARFTSEIDLSQAIKASDVESNNPNGFFLDGFIVFRPSNPDFSEISLPFLAFSGNWELDPPIIERLITEMNLEEELPYFVQTFSIYGIMSGIKNYGVGRNFTNNFSHLYSDEKTAEGKRFLVLGYDENENNLNEDYYISPNGDDNRDYVGFNGVFLRSYRDFKINVRDDSDNVIYSANILKNHGEKSNTIDGKFNNKSETHPSWIWNGKDTEGKYVNDGEYKFEVSTRIQDRPNAEAQVYSYTVKVDTTPPVIDEISQKEGTSNRRFVTLKASDEGSGVKGVYFSYDYVGGIYNTNRNERISFDKDEEHEGVYYLNPDKNGWHRLEGNNVPESFKIIVVDKAGNERAYDYNEEFGTGHLVLEKTNKNGGDDVPNDQFVAVNINTQKVFEDLSKLPNGDYRLVAKDEISGYSYRVIINGEEKSEFTISDDVQEVRARVEFEKIDHAELGKIIVEVFENASSKSIYKIYAKDSNGKRYNLSKDSGENTETFSALLPEGSYSLEVDGAIADGLGKVVDLKAKQTIKKNISLSDEIDKIKFSIETDGEDGTIEEFFGDDLVEVVRNRYKLKNPEKYFDIKGTLSGSQMDFEKALEGREDMLGEVTLLKSYGEFSGQISCLKGIKYDFDVIGYDADLYSVQVYNAYGQQYIDINKKTDSVGRLKINTNVKSEKYKDSLPLISYSIYNRAGHVEVKDITKIIPGNYIIEGKSDDPRWIMDPNSFEFEIIKDRVTEIDANWYYKDPSMHSNPQIRVNIGGYDGRQFDKLDLRFIDQASSEISEFSFDKNNLSRLISLPYGDYFVEIDGLFEGYLAKIKEADYSNYDVSQNGRAKISIKKLENEINLVINRDVEDFEENENTLEITQLFKDEKLNRIFQYKLSGDKTYTTSGTVFKNIEAGEYELKVERGNSRYVPVENNIKLTIRNGKNYVVVRFNEASNLEFISKTLGTEDDINVVYEAAVADGNSYEIFSQENFPIGVELDVYPLYMEGMYKIKTDKNSLDPSVRTLLKDKIDENGIYRDVTLEKGDTLEFHYEKDTIRSYNPYPLLNVEKHANKLLLETADYDEAYVSSLQNAVNTAENLLSNGGTQKEFDGAKNNLIELINNPVYNNNDEAMKDELFELVAKLDKLDLSMNSKEKVEKLRIALNSAKEILADKRAKQVEVDDMLAELKALEVELANEVSNLKIEQEIKDLLENFNSKSVEEKREILDKVSKLVKKMTRQPSEMVQKMIRDAKAMLKHEEEKEISDPGFYYPSPEYIERDKSKKENKKETKLEDKKNKPEDKPNKLIEDLLFPSIDETKEVTFTDIENSKYKEDIKKAYKRGLLNGISADLFAPKGNITRAEAMAILYRVSADKSYTLGSGFKDVDEGVWYADIAKWAMANGISNGDGLGNFNGEMVINREQFATLLYRFLKDRIEFKETEFKYKDSNKISSWALEAVSKLNSANILLGQDKDNYNAKGFVLREELAHVLENIIARMEK